MRIDRDVAHGDVVVDDEYELRGIRTGSVTVRGGAVFELRGILNGDVLVEDRGRLELRGILNGDVANAGVARVYGIVNGVVRTNGNGDTWVDPDAIIGAR
jgi:hypothetical protein